MKYDCKDCSNGYWERRLGSFDSMYKVLICDYFTNVEANRNGDCEHFNPRFFKRRKYK